VDLTIIGSGPEKSRLEALIERLGLTARVRFLGGRSWGNDLLELVRQHQALVLPSFTEGLPLVLIEAMSQGVPVIASAVGGIPELVHDGINGLLVSAGDVSGLAKAITRLTSDPGLRYRLAGEGLRAAESCTCEVQWGKAVDFIIETVARRRATPTPFPPKTHTGDGCYQMSNVLGIRQQKIAWSRLQL
jgi:glycosyltransferase involved in cell wall biosynthesis